MIQAIIKLRSLIIDISSRCTIKEAVYEDNEIKYNNIPGTIDPLKDSQTIAGLCSNLFRGLFINREGKEEIPIVPEKGFV